MILILFLRISCRDAQLGRLINKIIMSLWGQWRHPDGNNRDAQIGRLYNKIIMPIWGQWRRPDGNNRNIKIERLYSFINNPR